MPTNTFGPNDNYHPLNSHFLPSLVVEDKPARRRIIAATCPIHDENIANA